jgi:hypothetical protein
LKFSKGCKNPFEKKGENMETVLLILFPLIIGIAFGFYLGVIFCLYCGVLKKRKTTIDKQ